MALLGDIADLPCPRLGCGNGKEREGPGADVHHGELSLVAFEAAIDCLDELGCSGAVIAH